MVTRFAWIAQRFVTVNRQHLHGDLELARRNTLELPNQEVLRFFLYGGHGLRLEAQTIHHPVADLTHKAHERSLRDLQVD